MQPVLQRCPEQKRPQRRALVQPQHSSVALLQPQPPVRKCPVPPPQLVPVSEEDVVNVQVDPAKSDEPCERRRLHGRECWPLFHPGDKPLSQHKNVEHYARKARQRTSEPLLRPNRAILNRQPIVPLALGITPTKTSARIPQRIPSSPGPAVLREPVSATIHVDGERRQPREIRLGVKKLLRLTGLVAIAVFAVGGVVERS
jgi:hypothetical protein